jgi:5-methylcytosine-specific restriction endonuclease McrA
MEAKEEKEKEESREERKRRLARENIRKRRIEETERLGVSEARRINNERIKNCRIKKAKRLGLPYTPREKHNEPKEERAQRLDKERKARYRKNHIPQRKLGHYKSSAVTRTHPQPWLISDEEAFKLFQGNCHYCGTPPDPCGGIDRKDNSCGYIPGNVLSCCKICNYGKRTMPYEAFQAHLGRIAEHVLLFGINDSIVPSRIVPNIQIARTTINGYKTGAVNRNLSWAISDDEATRLLFSECHYCGKVPMVKNGIDRKDNERGYEPDNVAPCCIVCNFAKHAMPYQEYVEYLHRVSTHYFSPPEK